jgi:DNA invertase Pin-like site-specific DNA recombinase
MQDKPTDRSIPVVIYGAKSTQDPRGSIPTQFADCRAAIAQLGGREIVGEFSDEARSAFHGNRGDGLTRAKDAVIQAAIDHGNAELWSQHSDRLARGDGVEADHLVEIVLAMRRAKVCLRSVQDDSNLDDLIRAVLIGERNHEDSARKSAAVKSGKQRRAKQGKAVGGPVPDGYKLEPVLDADGQPCVERNGRLVYHRVPDPERAPLILGMLESSEQGKSNGDIQRALNIRGIRTQRGLEWTTRRVRETLMNPYYAGWIDVYGERIKGDHEPLIDSDRWEAIQANQKRLDPAAVQRRRGGRKGSGEFILSGVGFCSRCLAPMYQHRNPASRVYVCKNVRGCTGLCDAPRIHAEMVEDAVIAHLQNFVGDVEGWMKAKITTADEERAELERGLARHEKHLAFVSRDYDLIRTQYVEHLRAGHEAEAEVLLAEMTRAGADLKQQKAVVEEARTRLSGWNVAGHLDEALDAYNDLVQLVRARLQSANGETEVSAALHDLLNGVWFELDPDGGLFAYFELRKQLEDGQEGALIYRTREDIERARVDAAARGLQTGPYTFIKGLVYHWGIEIPPLVAQRSSSV